MSWYFLNKISKLSPPLDQINQNFGFLQRDYQKFNSSVTKITRKHTLGQTISSKKYTLAGGKSPGAFAVEELPPPVIDNSQTSSSSKIESD